MLGGAAGSSGGVRVVVEIGGEGRAVVEHQELGREQWWVGRAELGGMLFERGP